MFRVEKVSLGGGPGLAWEPSLQQGHILERDQDLGEGRDQTLGRGRKFGADQCLGGGPGMENDQCRGKDPTLKYDLCPGKEKIPISRKRFNPRKRPNVREQSV